MLRELKPAELRRNQVIYTGKRENKTTKKAQKIPTADSVNRLYGNTDDPRKIHLVCDSGTKVKLESPEHIELVYKESQDKDPSKSRQMHRKMDIIELEEAHERFGGKGP